MEYKPTIVEPDDPNRCQAIDNATSNQCNYKAVEGGTYCMRHGGNKQIERQEKDSLRNYHLTRWRARIESKASSPEIKSLRDEIGILRMMLETRLEQCQSEADLLMSTHTISELIIKIEKLVASCHKLETYLGKTLDKTAILNFASRLIHIITEIVEDKEIIEMLSQRIMQELGKLGEE